MSKPRRFTFSLLRMLLSMTAIAAVLAIGRWWDAHPAPIIVGAATAGLLMFVIRWRHWDVLLAEALGFFAGAFIPSCLSLSRLLPRDEEVIAPVVVGLFGWFVAAVSIRLVFRREVAQRMAGEEPERDVIEVRRLEEPNCVADDTAKSRRRDERT